MAPEPAAEPHPLEPVPGNEDRGRLSPLRWRYTPAILESVARALQVAGGFVLLGIVGGVLEFGMFGGAPGETARIIAIEPTQVTDCGLDARGVITTFRSLEPPPGLPREFELIGCPESDDQVGDLFAVGRLGSDDEVELEPVRGAMSEIRSWAGFTLSVAGVAALATFLFQLPRDLRAEARGGSHERTSSPATAEPGQSMSLRDKHGADAQVEAVLPPAPEMRPDAAPGRRDTKRAPSHRRHTPSARGTWGRRRSS